MTSCKKTLLLFFLLCNAAGLSAEPIKVPDKNLFDLGDLTNNKDGLSAATAVSADGSVVVGVTKIDTNYDHAFRWSETGGMVDLGDLTTNQDGFSYATAVSADGSVVVGDADKDNGIYHAFRWTKDSGMVDLGDFTPIGDGESNAFAVSADGSTVVGRAQTRPGKYHYYHAFRWTKEDGLVDLGDFTQAKDQHSTAWGVSADGSVVVGEASVDSVRSRAFRWTKASGLTDLGDFTTDDSGESFASAVSADGTVVVGGAHADNNFYHAFRWTEVGGMVNLGSFTTQPHSHSEATGMSADGSVVVGEATKESGHMHAFRWSEASGMIDLGDLTTHPNGESKAIAVNADGSVVVGEAEYDNDHFYRHAFLWTETSGMVGLGDFTTNQDGESKAFAVSADGTVIVGQAENDSATMRAFIYKLPAANPNPDPTPKPPLIEDHENVLRSFNKLATDREVAVFAHNEGTLKLLQSQCSTLLNANCFNIKGNFETVSGNHRLGGRQAYQGILTFGHAINNNWTAGVSTSLGRSNLHNNSVDPKNSYGVSGWVSYSQDKVSNEGLQVNASVGYASQNNTLTRGEGFEHVRHAEGTSKIKTVGARIAVGFGFNAGNGFNLQPEVAIAHQRNKLSAYRENSPSFTGSYDRSTLRTTALDVGLNVRKSLTETSRVRLKIGLEQDLTNHRMTMSGVSDVPGAKHFELKSQLSRNKSRPYLQAGYGYNVTDNSFISVDVGVKRSHFISKPEFGMGVGYTIRF